MTETILVIDDDDELRELLTEYFGQFGYEILTARDGAEGLKAAQTRAPDIVLLDIMLPGMNGLDVLKELRQTGNAPVIMLTARGQDSDRIVGLELGADDYVPKPFNPRELLARVRAVLRRAEVSPAQSAELETIVVGDVSLVLGTREVRVGDRPIQLTGAEFELLEYFLRRAGTVLKREEMYERVLGREFNGFDRSMDVHVSSLRKKLGHSSAGVDRIQAIRGVGYLYARSEEE